jgi:two-component system, sensor histidine kinase and response regulator
MGNMKRENRMQDAQSPYSPLIFLIDDVVQNLQVLSEVLRQEGFRISGAGSGATALRILKQVRPDLILCDIMMPEMDGYEVARQLKANPETADIPLIFLTARVESDDILKGFAVGGVDYVTKPFNSSELIARVKTHLELKQARDIILENTKHLSLLNEEKDQILNIAAHDLKNPLSSILLMAEMIQVRQGHLTPEKILDYADHIYQDADRMLLIITNLLDVNKIESGRIQAQWQNWPLKEVITRLRREYLPLAEKKEVTLHLDEPDRDLYIKTDPLLLFQLLDNLLSNALKFSQANKEIWLRFTPNPQGVLLEIEDQGPGFNPEDQKQMFQKFARLSAQPTAGENSTGLGLAIVKRLVEMLEIELDFHTEVDKGTSFSLQVPLAEIATVI